MSYLHNMSYVNNVSYINDMNYANNMSDVNNINNMSYVKLYELRHELCKLYEYFYESAKIK